MAKAPKRYIITSTRPMSGRSYASRPLTVEEAVDYYGYTLECGASWSHERGNKKINRRPTTIKSLITNLNNASNNSARNGCGDYYEAKEFFGEVAEMA
jgi:hypothetical protein